MYYHARITLYDKPALCDAVRACARNQLTGPFKFMISPYGYDKFILTRQQGDRLRDDPTGLSSMIITCSPDQILLYAGNCIDGPTLARILDGENP